MEVTVQVAHRQQVRPELNVRVEVQLSGHMIVSEQAAEDVYLALRDAMNATRRQLGDLARRRRDHSKIRIAEAVI